MAFSDAYERWFKRLLPSPFIIAILLTFVTVLLAFAFGNETNEGQTLMEVGKQWQSGIWNSKLLVFAFQMMFMLVLGHALALSKPISSAIQKVVQFCHNTSSAVVIVLILTVIVGFVNWGLALIFGAILARKVGEAFKEKGEPLNYPLIGAAGYTGLLVWHGGMSGSSLLKISEPGHLKSLTSLSNAALPDIVPVSETVFSSLNITTSLLLIIILALTAFLLAKRSPEKPYDLKVNVIEKNHNEEGIGAERLGISKYFGRLIGLLILVMIWFTLLDYSGVFLGFVNPNFINLTLLCFCLLFHSNINEFLFSIESAIGGAAGILLQFPLYFGIMGIMVESNLVSQFSHFLISFSNETTYPIFTFVSAAIVNVFVPSGGGQWAIQGPIIVDSYLQSGIPLQKSILAMAYGDELTNMLQPFWALPLLGITGLKAKQILPYTLVFMAVATIVFLLVLLLF